jgi:hypothetical protein
MRRVAYDVTHVLGCSLLQNQDVNCVFVWAKSVNMPTRVSEKLPLVSQFWKLIYCVVMVTLLNYVYYILSITCFLYLSKCVSMSHVTEMVPLYSVPVS